MNTNPKERSVNQGGWRRGLLPALAAAGLVLIAVAFLVTRVAGGRAPALSGTELGQQPAPDFALVDQRGQTVRLHDFSGKAVVLTFIYTHCPDVCPRTAESLRAADELLSTDARDRVAFLAVTVDPARDTLQALEQFSALHGLADNPRWFTLRGDPAALARVWGDYGIDPGRIAATPDGSTTLDAGGGLGHTDAIYFIDPAGNERVFMRSSATPQQIAGNLTALLTS